MRTESTSSSDERTVDTIVLVGHCGPDRWMLESSLRRHAPGVEIASVDDATELDGFANDRSLFLVNRVLDGRFRSRSGIELIRSLAEKSNGPRLMLISNYEDAQQEAERAGALPGFGKMEANDDGVAGSRVRAALV